jgi:DNA-binding MarR family transcriptional regulator
LGNELYVSFPNVTVMLSRLEKTGLIERTVNTADRRERFVKITNRGRELLKRIWQVQPDQLERVTSGLTESERLTLAQLLNKMIDGQISRSDEES